MVENEQTIHLPKYLALVDKLQKRYRGSIDLTLLTADLSSDHYHSLTCPI